MEMYSVESQDEDTVLRLKNDFLSFMNLACDGTYRVCRFL